MEKYKKGGYTILDLESSTIYKDALKALESNKPVLVYDLPDVYFADTIKATTIDGDDVVQITKGGKTITIANDNTITNVGDIQLKVFGLYVGQSSEDAAIRLVTIDNVDVTIEQDTFDDVSSIEGLYKIISSLKNNIDYKFFNDSKELVEIYIATDGDITMNVDGVKVLDCKVNNDDTITYTTTDDYFYISHLQLF